VDFLARRNICGGSGTRRARSPPLRRAGKRHRCVHRRSLICQSMSKLLTRDAAMGGGIGRTHTKKKPGSAPALSRHSPGSSMPAFKF